MIQITALGRKCTQMVILPTTTACGRTSTLNIVLTNSRTAIALAEPSSDNEDESDSDCSGESSSEDEFADDSDDEDPDNDAVDDGFAIAELGEM